MKKQKVFWQGDERKVKIGNQRKIVKLKKNFSIEHDSSKH